MKLNFEKLIKSARAHSVDTSPAEFGFETRLLAAICDRGQSTENGFLDTFGNWLWKGGLGLTPLVAVLLAFAIFFQGLNIPDGTSEFVAYFVSTLLSR